MSSAFHATTIVAMVAIVLGYLWRSDATYKHGVIGPQIVVDEAMALRSRFGITPLPLGPTTARCDGTECHAENLCFDGPAYIAHVKSEREVPGGLEVLRKLLNARNATLHVRDMDLGEEGQSAATAAQESPDHDNDADDDGGDVGSVLILEPNHFVGNFGYMLTSNLASLCMSGSIFDGGTASDEHQSKGDQTRQQTLFAINVARFREQSPTPRDRREPWYVCSYCYGHLILPKLRALAAGVRSASSTVLLMGAEDNKMDVSSRAAGQPPEVNGLRHARGCFARARVHFPVMGSHVARLPTASRTKLLPHPLGRCVAALRRGSGVPPPPAPRPGGPGRVTLIDRTTSRRISNLGVLARVLNASPAGLQATRMKLESMSAAEQMAALARTDVLVGAHGAGLANVLLMPSRHEGCAALVQIQLPMMCGGRRASKKVQMYERAARIAGAEYLQVSYAPSDLRGRGAWKMLGPECGPDGVERIIEARMRQSGRQKSESVEASGSAAADLLGLVKTSGGSVPRVGSFKWLSEFAIDIATVADAVEEAWRRVHACRTADG
jgi:hypothetical protein